MNTNLPVVHQDMYFNQPSVVPGIVVIKVREMPVQLAPGSNHSNSGLPSLDVKLA